MSSAGAALRGETETEPGREAIRCDGGVYAGPFEALQELEDEGDFDAVVANAPPGDGYWALPEEWGVASNMLAGGGITLLNDVPAL